ncbi:MAG: hypothetical protein ACP5N2_01305 [Candidatus Nanoarchaeia archaeon]
MRKKPHTTRLICLLVGILFLPLAIYLIFSKQYIQFIIVLVAAALACDMLNRLFKDKKAD